MHVGVGLYLCEVDCELQQFYVCCIYIYFRASYQLSKVTHLKHFNCGVANKETTTEAHLMKCIKVSVHF